LAPARDRDAVRRDATKIADCAELREAFSTRSPYRQPAIFQSQISSRNLQIAKSSTIFNRFNRQICNVSSGESRTLRTNCRGSLAGSAAEHRADRHADPGDVSTTKDVARHDLAGRVDAACR
jgi:hypothetical protein